MPWNDKHTHRSCLKRVSLVLSGWCLFASLCFNMWIVAFCFVVLIVVVIVVISCCCSCLCSMHVYVFLCWRHIAASSGPVGTWSWVGQSIVSLVAWGSPLFVQVSRDLVGSFCVTVVWQCRWHRHIHLYQSGPVGLLCCGMLLVLCSVGDWRTSPSVISASDRCIVATVFALDRVHYVRCVARGFTLCYLCPSRYFAPDLSGVNQSGVEWALGVSAVGHDMVVVVTPTNRWLCEGWHMGVSKVSNTYYVHATLCVHLLLLWRSETVFVVIVWIFTGTDWFKFGPDQSFGQVWIGPVCHSGGASEESSEQRYLGAVVGTGPMLQYYFECSVGVGTVFGDECGLLGFQWCLIIAFAVLF